MDVCFFQSAGYPFDSSIQGAVGLTQHKGTLLTCFQLLILKIPGSFPTKLLSIQSIPSIYPGLGFFYVMGRASHSGVTV